MQKKKRLMYTFEAKFHCLKNIFRKVVSLHTINHKIHSFFNVSFLGFVDAPVMCIKSTVGD